MQNKNLKMQNIKKIAYKKYLQHGFLIKNDPIDQDQYQNTDQVNPFDNKN